MRTRQSLIYLIATICLVATQASAQDIVVNQGGAATQEAVPAAADAGNGTIIVNTQRQAVSTQPATVVQATPVTNDTRTEQLRKARESAEIGTEQKLVEKLEESRIQDEKTRADRLFGPAAAAPITAPAVAAPAATPAVVVVQPAAQPVAQPVAPAAAVAPQAQPVVVVAPVAAQPSAVEAVKAEVKDHPLVNPMEEPKKMYVIGGIGTSQYYGAINVSSNAAAGVAVGWNSDDHIAYEADFIYSNYYINEYWRPPYAAFKQMAQYNFEGAIKYSFMTGPFRPFVGGLTSYTYRSYTNRGACLCGGMPGDSSFASSAVDVGLLVGAEYKLSKEFAVGLEYRYMMNLWARTDDRFIKPDYLLNGTTPIENMSYYSFMLNGKYTF